ncbi:type II toxin-antitoxin system VapC family toxin [Cyanobium sp. Maggiore-St4-Cus]|uniref:type II toxin-antitoxin system VapC family toxin n=1 Tax=unclassified Cyanobium TaxID=2627006 RepID=UPI0028F441FC|nr:MULTISPECIES: type II toxin-antitoxin system VapC family toxin [unclassified Cyanobium]MCP9789481.1 type II toxin-antitoxin system VapC family toxin [Cyanobium sp. Maggiore-St4-Cus]MCP9823152.1 type II toxin-antitoxin system VapC family toxin [Cyanobium sp. L1E-Cus]
MILDTSVLLAILQREPGWERHQQALEQAEVLRMSAGTLQELLLVAHCRRVLEPMRTLLNLIDPDLVPVDADLAERALGIFKRFGKGQGHPAQLNFGDCFAAALAERDQLPLGYIGDDFSKAGF